MKLTRYGLDVLVVTLLIALGLIIGGLLIELPVVRWGMVTLGLLLSAFTLYFFRDPERTLPSEADGRTVISPADGKVFLIHDVEDTEYHKGPAKLVAIFLSPLDVHVNRNPISGEVDHMVYHKGEFVPAFKDKSSEVNERTHIGIRGEHFRLMMKQIAGAVARRIVCPLQVGDPVKVGERFGMIKFGSRTDLILPPEMEILVKPGDRVVGGVTIISRMPS
ncbi:MAG: phosphatidylserine decarboxylase family protein [Candidatus Kapaibacterium sp.]